MTAETAWPRRRFLYIGDRSDSAGKLSSGLILLPEDADGELMTADLPGAGWWKLKARSRSSLRGVAVGAVVEMETEVREDGTSVRFGTLRTTGLPRWYDDAAVLRWTAEHRADRAEAERRKKMKDRDALHEALDPIREMYSNLRGRHRTAILAEIVRYITN